MTSATYTATEQPAAKRFRRAMDRDERVDDALGEIICLLHTHPDLDVPDDHPEAAERRHRRTYLMQTLRSLDRRGR